MERKEFLNTIGIGAAFVLTAGCFGSCSKASNNASTNVDFTLDLTAVANAALMTNGGYIVINNCVVARTNTGTYAAATVVCTHQGFSQITYDGTTNNWYCTAHGARYDIAGAGLNGNGAKGLKIYKTQLTGTSLRVYS